jgi:hypothetical protein
MALDPQMMMLINQLKSNQAVQPMQQQGAGIANGVQGLSNNMMQMMMANKMAQNQGNPLPFPGLGGLMGMGQHNYGPNMLQNASANPMGSQIGPPANAASLMPAGVSQSPMLTNT